MLQLIGYLLCFYLVFKGIEIYQIAVASPKEKKGFALTIGALAVVFAILLAVSFGVAFSVQSHGLPTIPPR